MCSYWYNEPVNKTVFITGASSGIGRECALLFAKKGWSVAATMRSPEKETEFSKLKNVICPKLDVTDTGSIAKAISKTIETFGKIDVVVNNAGFGLVGPFEASTDEEVKKEFETNVFGTMNVIREILPHFREQKAGAIVNISSMGGRVTFPLYSVYHATKWAIEGFSESLQYELKPLNIKVKIIEPGVIKTNFYTDSAHIVHKKGLTAYDNYVDSALPYLQSSGASGSHPKVVAETVYKASTEGTSRLRYPTGKSAGLALTMRKLLPDAIYSKVIRKMVLG